MGIGDVTDKMFLTNSDQNMPTSVLIIIVHKIAILCQTNFRVTSFSFCQLQPVLLTTKLQIDFRVVFLLSVAALRKADLNREDAKCAKKKAK